MAKTLEKNSHPGILTANLAAPSEQYDLSLLVAQINANIKPPTPVNEGDVYIRAMYIVSDAINAYGGRFPADEHQRLAELLVDAPVLVGHRKDQLPVGRNFHAVIEVKDGQSWVKSYFYWLKSSEGAQSIRDNIDGGIYKECSIGFMYGLAECSVCGSDMRSCSHATTPDGSVWFSYRQIQRVLETSLVYRGATPDTSISRDLQIEKWEGSVAQVQPREWNPRPIDDCHDLDPSAEYVVIPAYHGVPVIVSVDSTKIEARSLAGKALLSLPVVGGVTRNLKSPEQFEGLLVGMRGKDRCSAAETELYLSKGRGPVSRVELRMLPCNGKPLASIPAQCGELSLRRMRASTASGADVNSACRNLQTREGVYLWRTGTSPFGGNVYSMASGQRPGTTGLSQNGADQHSDVVLEIAGENSTRRFVIPQKSLARLESGKGVVAREVQNAVGGESEPFSRGIRLHGNIIREEGRGITCTLAGKNSRLHVRPIRIHGMAKFLIHTPQSRNGEYTAGAVRDAR